MGFEEEKGKREKGERSGHVWSFCWNRGEGPVSQLERKDSSQTVTLFQICRISSPKRKEVGLGWTLAPGVALWTVAGGRWTLQVHIQILQDRRTAGIIVRFVPYE